MKLTKWHYIGIAIIPVIALLAIFTGGTNLPVDSQDAIKGDLNAPVTIIEYSDFECPYCQRFYSNTFPLIEADYIDTGLVKYIRKDFPLSSHIKAIPAAKAAECAGEQDKYYEMADQLYKNGVESESSKYIDYAEAINLDISEYKTCYKNSNIKKEIIEDRDQGMEQGISSTPSFLINGELVKGAQPYAVFKEVIERKLNN